MENQNNTATQEVIILGYLAEGNPMAVEKIAETYSQYLRNFLRKMGATDDVIQDVLQDVFLRLCLYLNKHGSLKLEHLRSYLGKMAINSLLTYLKKENRISSNLTLEENVSFTNSSDLDIDPEKILIYFVKKLPEKQKEVFCLKYFDKMSSEEISQKLGMNLSAIKIAYFHAKKTISYYLLQN